MTEIDLTTSTLLVHVSGADKFWAFKSQLEIPLIHVIGAEVDPAVGEHWDDMVKGIRLPGTHLPGVIAAGSFYSFYNSKSKQALLN